MIRLGKLTIILFTVLLINYGMAFSQSSSENMAKEYKLSEKSTMVISGTSTIHDWESEVKDFSSELKIEPNLFAQQKGADIEEGLKTSVSVSVESIESGKSGMDDKTYKALEKDEHPNIEYELISSEIISSNSTGNDGPVKFELNTTGELTIKGVTKEIEMNVEGEKTEDGSLHFKGDKELDMETFKVDPPSAMFGTVKAGKMVTVSYDLTYNPVQ